MYFSSDDKRLIYCTQLQLGVYDVTAHYSRDLLLQCCCDATLVQPSLKCNVHYTVQRAIAARLYIANAILMCVSNMQQSAAITDPAAIGQGSAQHSPASRQDHIKPPVVPDQMNVDALKAYAAGRNSRQQKLAAGLPILSDSLGTVQLVLECDSQVGLPVFWVAMLCNNFCSGPHAPWSLQSHLCYGDKFSLFQSPSHMGKKFKP